MFLATTPQIYKRLNINNLRKHISSPNRKFH